MKKLLLVFGFVLFSLLGCEIEPCYECTRSEQIGYERHKHVYLEKFPKAEYPNRHSPTGDRIYITNYSVYCGNNIEEYEKQSHHRKYSDWDCIRFN